MLIIALISLVHAIIYLLQIALISCRTLAFLKMPFQFRQPIALATSNDRNHSIWTFLGRQARCS